MPTFSRDDSNNILQTLFNGDNFSRNSYIKQSELYTRIKTEANQFRKNRDSFRTIEDIASVNKDKNNKIKTDNYYAVVQADGDNMGKFLSDLNDESVGEFSKRCLNYTSKAAKKIGEYGGMTIYAGGDDLLFLAPVTDKEGKLIIKLCKEINDTFKEEMKDIQGADNNKIPTISFGVSIQYCKAPLYEAINKARGFLFGVAKDSKSEKNRIALNVQKHSGQSFGIIIPNDEVETANKVFDAVSEDIIAKNALQTIKKFKGFLSLAAEKLKGNKDSFKKSWSNWFDNVNQAGNSYYETLGDLFYDNFVNNDSKISRISDEKETTDKINSENLNAYISLLSIKKFMIEKEVIE